MARRKQNHQVTKLHYKIGLHPVFLLALCCAGVILLAATVRAFADQTYTVRATVEADPLAHPAVITSPTTGSQTSVADNTIEGTCPTLSYVKLFINGSLHGSVVCDAAGTFSLRTTLSPGRNSMVAQAYNLTDQPGPVGATTLVEYVVPTIKSQTPSSSVTSSSSAVDGERVVDPTSDTDKAPLVFECTCEYQAKYVDDVVYIPITMKGGVAPYDLQVDWGDGTSDAYIDQPGPVITISHAYKPFSAGLKAFTVSVDVTDAAGTKALYQIYQLVRNTAFQPAVAGPTLPIKTFPWLTALPVFGFVALLVFSFWLGERHELEVARTKPKRRPPRRHA